MDDYNYEYNVPDGMYIVAITDMSVGSTKGGRDALKVEFTISEGQYKHRRLFYTQVIYKDGNFTHRKIMSFLRSIGHEDAMPFFSMETLRKEVPRILEDVKNTKEFDLWYKENGEQFPIFNVTGIYDLY